MKELIQTKASNCGQTALSMFLSYYGIDESTDFIENNVNIHYNDLGSPMGSATPDFALYIISKNLPCTIEVFDSNFFDRTLIGKSQKEILESCKVFYEQGKAHYESEHKDLYLKSYIEFMQRGGKINLSHLTIDLIKSILDSGPVLTNVQYQYLNSTPNVFLDNPDADVLDRKLKGRPTTHSIVLSSYENNRVTYYDPKPVDKKTVVQETKIDLMLGAIMASQIESDNVLIYSQ